jgi:predicted esterase
MIFFASSKTIVVLLLLLNMSVAQSQTTAPVEIVEPSIVVTSSKELKKDKYGVLFVLPFTGSPSEKFMRVYFNDWNPKANWQKGYNAFVDSLRIKKQLILVMVSGSTSTRDHDAQGFAAAIKRFDDQIKKDLAVLEKKYTIDKSNLYLTGFSLGGDLSWAISQRNPGLFKGAVIGGSRCGYRTNHGFSVWKNNNFKVYLAAGQQESPVIQKGLEQAKTDLLNAGIEHMYLEIPNVGHKMIPQNQFLEGLRFVLEP